MRRVGLTIGQASPFSALYTGRPLLLLTGAGVIAGGAASCPGARDRRVAQWLLLILGISGSSSCLPSTRRSRWPERRWRSWPP